MGRRYEYIEKEQVKFEWFVPEKVFLSGKTFEDLMFVIPNLGKGGIEDIYNPFEENPTLFIEFLSLSPTPPEIAKFIQKWGTLRGGGVWMEPEEFEFPAYYFRNGKPWENIVQRDSQELLLDMWEMMTPSMQRKLFSPPDGEQKEKQREAKRTTPQRKEPPVLEYESLEFWTREIWNMNMVFQAWKILEERDVALLHKVALITESQEISYGTTVSGFFFFTNLPRETALKQDTKKLYAQLKEGSFQNTDTILSSLPKNVPFLAYSGTGFVAVVSENNLDDLLFSLLKDFIGLRVNFFLRRGVYPVLHNEKGHFTTYLKPRDLLSALWLQFYFVLVGEKRVKRCSVCGLWEDVTDKTKGWSKHRECSQRERFRKYYEKVKEVRELHRQGKTPEEIASLLGKSVEWVEKQLKKEGESHGPSGEP